ADRCHRCRKQAQGRGLPPRAHEHERRRHTGPRVRKRVDADAAPRLNGVPPPSQVTPGGGPISFLAGAAPHSVSPVPGAPPHISLAAAPLLLSGGVAAAPSYGDRDGLLSHRRPPSWPVLMACLPSSLAA
uniref:Uncharacterized protein n=1 Tax=Zea mays TaxID=4577 RepID=A0A804PSQ5_MAIZE